MTTAHDGSATLVDGTGRAEWAVDRLVPRVVYCSVFLVLLSGAGAFFATSALTQLRAPLASDDEALLAAASGLLAMLVALTASQRLFFDLRWLLAAAPLVGLFLGATVHQPAERWVGGALALCGTLLGHLILLRDRWALAARSDLHLRRLILPAIFGRPEQFAGLTREQASRTASRRSWRWIAFTSAMVVVVALVAASTLRRPSLQPKLDALEAAWDRGALEELVAIAPAAKQPTLTAYLQRVALDQRWGRECPEIDGIMLTTEGIARSRQLFRGADETFVATRTLEGSPLLLETTWSWDGDDWLLVSLWLRPPS